MRLGFCRGRPLGRGTLTSASVASASVTSPGEALSSRTPSGRPSPSTSTIHFVPLPRLVLPTAEPLFSLERSCRPGTSLPTSADLRHRAHPVAFARRRATHPALPTASTAASRSQAKGTCRARTSTPRPSATPTECPPDRPGSTPTDGLACPCAASAQAAAARSTPTAHRSTTGTASCSCKKFIKPPVSRRSLQLEAEPIYETRSRDFMKAIAYHNYGSPDVLQCEDIEKPVPMVGEVLIKVRAASVNPLDRGELKGVPHIFRIVFGLRKPEVTQPGRPGVDVAGVVEAVAGTYGSNLATRPSGCVSATRSIRVSEFE